MNAKTRSAAFLAMAILAFLTIGCELRVNQAVKPTATLWSMEDDLKQADVQIDAVTQSLLELQTSEEFEVKEAFQEYKANAERMELVGDRMRRHFHNMHTLGLEYFTEWNRQGTSYSNPRLRMLDRERLDQLSERYLQIGQEGDKAERAYDPFRFDVTAIKNADTKNATMVEALSSIIEKARNDGETLKQALRGVLEEVTRTRTEMGEFGTPNHKKEPEGDTPRRMEPSATRSEPVPVVTEQQAPAAAEQPVIRRMEQGSQGQAQQPTERRMERMQQR